MDAGSGRTVLFVCEHGALRSRLAAEFFNRAAVGGWRATSAGIEPQAWLSVFTLPLAKGQGLESLLDSDPPRPLTSVPTPDLVVTVDCHLEGGVSWQLRCREVGDALAAELRARAEQVARELADERG